MAPSSRLQRLADSIDLDSVPAISAQRLAYGLGQLGDPARAVALLRRLRLRNPEDYWINVDLANLLLNRAPPALEEVIRFATAAVAIRRKSPSGYDPLASALVNSGRLDEALAEYGELIRLYPEGSMARSNFGAMLAMHGELDQAAEQFREAIRLDPENQIAHRNLHAMLGSLLLENGDLGATRAKIHELLGLKPDDATIQYQAALLQLAANPDGEVYCKVATAILDRLGGTDDPGVAYDVARAGSLAPGATDLPQKLVALAEKSAAHAPREGWRMYVLGLALYRAGRYEEAIRKLNESREADPNWHATALNWPVLAMAHCRLGHADEATRWLAQAEQQSPQSIETWWDRLELKLILREAQVLVRDSLFPGDPFAR